MTDATIHDSQVFDDVIDPLVQDRAVYAESGYRSAAREASLAGAGIASRIHVRAHVNVPLSDASKAANREKSSVRVRVEHIFGFLHTSMNRGGFVRTIGSQRAQVIIALAISHTTFHVICRSSLRAGQNALVQQDPRTLRTVQCCRRRMLRRRKNGRGITLSCGG